MVLVLPLGEPAHLQALADHNPLTIVALRGIVVLQVDR